MLHPATWVVLCMSRSLLCLGILLIFRRRMEAITNTPSENNTIHIAQFGGKPLSWFANEEPARDIYPAFTAIDKFLSFKDWRGCTIVMGPFYYYITKTFTIRRMSWHLRGATGPNNTVIRCPWNVSPIAICANQGGDGGIALGPDYSSFPFSFRNVNVGQAYWKQNGQPNPGGVYRCTVAGVSHGSGGDDGLTGTDTTATYTSGTAQFKYERQCGPELRPRL